MATRAMAGGGGGEGGGDVGGPRTRTAQADPGGFAAASEHALAAGEEVVVPVAEELLRLAKREVETGRVRVRLTTETVPETLRETLRHRRAEVERVPVADAPETDAPPQTRHEGGTLVIPVVEEVLVVTRRYRVREELRLRLVTQEETVERTAERRVQSATVERLPPADEGAREAGSDAPALPDAAE